jgi:hypothetical protein
MDCLFNMINENSISADNHLSSVGPGCQTVCWTSTKEYLLKKLQCSLILMFMLGSLSFMNAAPQDNASGPPAPVEWSGMVIGKDGKFLLTDEKSQQTIELRGKNLKRFAGKTVNVKGRKVAGAVPIAGGAEVILVTNIGTAAATGVAAGTATAAGASSGLSGAAVAVIGGTAAAAGTVGGLYASGTIGEDQPVSQP